MKINYVDYITDTVLNYNLTSIDEYIGTGLCYSYYYNGEYKHEHSFNGLLRMLAWDLGYDEEERYELDFSEFLDDYSDQELRVISHYVNYIKALKHAIKYDEVNLVN